MLPSDVNEGVEAWWRKSGATLQDDKDPLTVSRSCMVCLAETEPIRSKVSVAVHASRDALMQHQ